MSFLPSNTDRHSDQVKKLLGQGTFGKVVKAYDNRTKREVAVKIIRSVQKYRDASRIELRVLSTLASNDRSNRNKCIHLRDTFDFRNHICIVTDLLGQSVFDFLKGNSFVPFPSSHIQQFARQLFTSVACQYWPTKSIYDSFANTCFSSTRPESRAYRSEARKYPPRQQHVPDLHLQPKYPIILKDHGSICKISTSTAQSRNPVDRLWFRHVR